MEEGREMTITNERPILCPECGFILDWGNSFSTIIYQCRYCGYIKEYDIFTGKEYKDKYVPLAKSADALDLKSNE